MTNNYNALITGLDPNILAQLAGAARSSYYTSLKPKITDSFKATMKMSAEVVSDAFSSGLEEGVKYTRKEKSVKVFGGGLHKLKPNDGNSDELVHTYIPPSLLSTTLLLSQNIYSTPIGDIATDFTESGSL